MPQQSAARRGFGNMDIASLSQYYDIRELDESDADLVLDLCQGNTLFYRFCEAEPRREQVLNDMHITPPGIALTDKYYIGFFHEDRLIAVMDLIDGYPEPDIVYIGFFMMDVKKQGQGIGTAIIQDAAAYLKSIGKTALRLGIDKGNPQSTHFWKKNGFRVLYEVDRNGWTALVAEKALG